MYFEVAKFVLLLERKQTLFSTKHSHSCFIRHKKHSFSLITLAKVLDNEGQKHFFRDLETKFWLTKIKIMFKILNIQLY